MICRNFLEEEDCKEQRSNKIKSLLSIPKSDFFDVCLQWFLLTFLHGQKNEILIRLPSHFQSKMLLHPPPNYLELPSIIKLQSLPFSFAVFHLSLKEVTYLERSTKKSKDFFQYRLFLNQLELKYLDIYFSYFFLNLSFPLSFTGK